MSHAKLELVFKSGQGCLAEYVRVPATHVAPRPADMKPTEAAGLAYAGLTAYQAIFTNAGLEAGQSLFINGGSTTVGLYAMQMAKALGCKVAVSASAKREAFLRTMGVDEASSCTFSNSVLD